MTAFVKRGKSATVNHLIGPRTPFDRSANLTFVAPISPNNLCSCEKSIERPEAEFAGEETSISHVHSALSWRHDVCVSPTKLEKPDHRHRRLLPSRRRRPPNRRTTGKREDTAPPHHLPHADNQPPHHHS